MDQEVLFLREGIIEMLNKCEDVEFLQLIKSMLAFCIV